jgi:hypothetical protein
VDVGEWSALAGLRYTIAPEARLRTTLLAQVQRQSIPVFLHSVDGDFEMYPAPALGGRAGLAFGLGEGRVRSGLELAELLVPWPVDTSAGLHVEAELIQGLGLRAGAELHLRTLRYDVAAIDEVYVMDQQAQALVGLSYRR